MSKWEKNLEIKLDSNILNLVTSVETDVTKAVHEALNLWLRERLTACPITKNFCINPKNPCNDCILVKNNF